MIVLEIFIAILILPFLLAITFFNTEPIFQGYFMDISTMIYGLYFFLSLAGLIVLKIIKIKNIHIKQELYSSMQFVCYIALLSLPAIGLVHYFVLSNGGGTDLYFRAYGKVAFLYLVMALSISPIVSFVKNKNISDTLILIRKVLGILSFLFFMRHGIEYFNMEYEFAIKHTPAIGYLEYVWQNLLIRIDALTGVIAGIIMFVLGITSNKISIKILSGNTWKKLQSLVYPAFFVSSIHVAFTSRFDAFYVALILWLVYIRTISYLQNNKNNLKKGGYTSKYMCMPCGYIYDEALGDPDGGLEPGTKFDDIPDDRVCPVCGVSRLSFEPYYDTEESTSKPGGIVAKVSNYIMLTKDVLELTLSIDKQVDILPGQHVSLAMKDFDGEFVRRYSVVENNGNNIKLGIKIKETGRGGRALRNLRIGDELKINSIDGNFTLKTTSNTKIFIATGTGISPLYHMISRNTFSEDNILFWGVSKEEDLFYLEKLNTFKNLKLELFLSKEDIQGYHYGRIDTSAYEFSLDSEFYLCGNAPMVRDQMDFLKGKGYKNIYVEVF